MNILVTGAAGFIGSQLCESLITRGDQVLGIDNFDPFYSVENKKNNLKNLSSSSNFKFLNISLNDELTALVGEDFKFDVIVHLAAKAGVRPSLADPAGYYFTNVNGTQNLLDFAVKRRIPKFVFASSSSVYGENPKRPWFESDSDLLPISPYASSKLAGEHLGHVYSLHNDLQFIALRFFTVFGPRQRPDLAIRKFIELIKEKKKIPVFGDGSTTRDYTFVSDTIAGIVSAVDHGELPNFDIFNLGRGDSISLSEMISTISDVLKIEADIERLPFQPGDVGHTQASIQKAESLLDYRPQVSFRDGVGALVDWQNSCQ